MDPEPERELSKVDTGTETAINRYGYTILLVSVRKQLIFFSCCEVDHFRNIASILIHFSITLFSVFCLHQKGKGHHPLTPVHTHSAHLSLTIHC